LKSNIQLKKIYVVENVFNDAASIHTSIQTDNGSNERNESVCILNIISRGIAKSLLAQAKRASIITKIILND
jgi:hypothetical protein